MKEIFCMVLCVAAFASCTNVKREKELTARNDSLTVALNALDAFLCHKTYSELQNFPNPQL